MKNTREHIQLPAVHSFTMYLFILQQNTSKITTNYKYNLEVDHKNMTFARGKVPYVWL